MLKIGKSEFDELRLQVARQLKKNEHAVFVAILPDSGDKYLSERFWQED